MRLLQYVDNLLTRVARADDAWPRHAAAALRDHVPAGAAGDRRALHPGPDCQRRSTRRAARLRRPAAGRPAAAAAHSPGSGALPGVGHRPHASRQRGGARFDAPEAEQTGCRAHRFDEDVQVGRRGRQARRRPARHAAGMVLQGQRRATWSPAAGRSRRPTFAEDYGEEPEMVGLLPHRRAGPAAAGSASPSATSSPTTSPSAATIYCWRIRSCASAASDPMLNAGALPRTSKAPAASAATAACCGRSPSSPAKAT